MVSCNIRNLLSVSKFPRDNDVVFEFLTDKCFIKSQVSRLTFLEGFCNSSGLYYFSDLVVEPSRMPFVSCSSSTSTCTNAKFISCSMISSVNKPRSSLLWHFRLGHTNYSAIRQALKHYNISVSHNSNIIVQVLLYWKIA